MLHYLKKGDFAKAEAKFTLLDKEAKMQNPKPVETIDIRGEKIHPERSAISSSDKGIPDMTSPTVTPSPPLPITASRQSPIFLSKTSKTPPPSGKTRTRQITPSLTDGPRPLGSIDTSTGRIITQGSKSINEIYKLANKKTDFRYLLKSFFKKEKGISFQKTRIKHRSKIQEKIKALFTAERVGSSTLAWGIQHKQLAMHGQLQQLKEAKSLVLVEVLRQ